MGKQLIPLLTLFVFLASCSAKSDSGTIQSADANILAVDSRSDSCDFSDFKPVRISHFVQSNLERRVVPEYPLGAVDRGADGVVSVKILVDREGSVVRSCTHDGDSELAKAAEEAVLKWKFKRDVVPGFETYVEEGVSFRFILDDKNKVADRFDDEIVVYQAER